MFEVFGGITILLLTILCGIIWKRRLKQGKERLRREFDLDTSRILIEDAQFTVYRPQAVRPKRWYTLLAFVHRSKAEGPSEPDPVEEVTRLATQVLGDDSEDYQVITEDSSQPVPKEGEITLVPDFEGIEFNPRQRTFRWTEAVHREEFRFRAESALDGQTVRGRLSAYVGVVLIADVNLAIRVETGASGEKVATKAGTASPYRKIFASYSRKDLPVVLQFEHLARALGDRYLRDLTTLRAGEPWNSRLQEMILEANVFQLFWSWNAMDSPLVRQEWEYALSLGRPNFVRPTYWEEPMPRQPGLPPAELEALHFHRLGFEPREGTLEEGFSSKGPRTSSRSRVAATSLAALFVALGLTYLGYQYRSGISTDAVVTWSSNPVFEQAAQIYKATGWVVLPYPDSKYGPGAVVQIAEGHAPDWLGSLTKDCGVPPKIIETGTCATASFELNRAIVYDSMAVLQLQGVSAGPLFSRIRFVSLQVEDCSADAFSILAFEYWLMDPDREGKLEEGCLENLSRPDTYIVREAIRVSRGAYTFETETGARLDLKGVDVADYLRLSPEAKVKVGEDGSLEFDQDVFLAIRRLKHEDVSEGTLAETGTDQEDADLKLLLALTGY